MILKAIKSISVGVMLQVGFGLALQGLAVQANTHGLWEGQSTHRERERIQNEIRYQQIQDSIERGRSDAFKRNSSYF